LARLAIFGAFVLGLFIFWGSPLRAAAFSLPVLGVFLSVLVFHWRILERKRLLEGERLLLTEQRQRLEVRRRVHPPPRVPPDPTPLEAGHGVYAPEPDGFALDEGIVDDLNLFESASSPAGSKGARTLFGLLDWTQSCFGSRRLKYMLLHPLLEKEPLRARQDAAREFAAKPELRQRLLLSLVPLRQHVLDPLGRIFLETPAYARRRGLFLWASLLGTLMPLGIVAISVTGRLEMLPFIFFMVVLSFVTIGLQSKESNVARGRFLLLGPLLEGFLQMEEALSAGSLEASSWIGIREALRAVQMPARRLKKYAGLLSFHGYGALFEMVNVITLWELRLLPLADTLFDRHRGDLERATGAFGDAEALLCLSLPLTEQGFELPQILSEARPIVRADEVGHPLLDPGHVVMNPVSLGEEANVLIVTGSNMSGKSTYLKSVATNLVLAGMGGPVCARGFRWTPLALYSDVNVSDSLEDGKSYFQVEVERVYRVIQAAAKGPKPFAIFDELFRGTNSEERIAIARAVIRYLRSAGALVIVATHDLSLTRMVTQDAEPGMVNLHFQERVEDGVMHFDYRLREGPAVTRNALRVLEAYGYPEEIIREARRSGRPEDDGR
jgi:hypothetical protein